MDRIFFYLYNWYLKNTITVIKRTSDDAIGLASWILGMGVGLWFLLADEICSFFLHYNLDNYHSIFLISLGLISGGIFHSYYLGKDRTVTIYNKYKSSLTAKNIRKGTIFSFVFIFSPLVLVAVWVAIVNNFLSQLNDTGPILAGGCSIVVNYNIGASVVAMILCVSYACAGSFKHSVILVYKFRFISSFTLS